MTKKIVSALSAVVLLGGLAACGDETVEEGDTTYVATDPADEAVDVELPDAPVEDDGDSVSISEDGVSADINDGNTSINAEIGDEPSMTVETD